MYVVTCVLRETKREGGREGGRERGRERERERESKSAQAYVVSRCPPTHPLA